MQDFNHDAGTMPTGKSARRHRQRIGAILREAIDFLDQPADSVRFLDVGCSSGSVLHIASEMHIGTVCGVEPAPKAAATAQQLGYAVFSGYLHEAAYADASFDLVTTFEVVEHLADAGSMAKEVSRILRPGGLWLIGTGNAESWTAERLREQWEYYSIAQNGGHISFFNPRSIALLGQRHGMSVAYLRTKRTLGSPPAARTRLGKLRDELMAIPARLTGRGHDMLAALRKR